MDERLVPTVSRLFLFGTTFVNHVDPLPTDGGTGLMQPRVECRSWKAPYILLAIRTFNEAMPASSLASEYVCVVCLWPMAAARWRTSASVARMRWAYVGEFDEHGCVHGKCE